MNVNRRSRIARPESQCPTLQTDSINASVSAIVIDCNFYFVASISNALHLRGETESNSEQPRSRCQQPGVSLRVLTWNWRCRGSGSPYWRQCRDSLGTKPLSAPWNCSWESPRRSKQCCVPSREHNFFLSISCSVLPTWSVACSCQTTFGGCSAPSRLLFAVKWKTCVWGRSSSIQHNRHSLPQRKLATCTFLPQEQAVNLIQLRPLLLFLSLIRTTLFNQTLMIKLNEYVSVLCNRRTSENRPKPVSVALRSE